MEQKLGPSAEKIWKETFDKDSSCGSQKVCNKRGQGLEERLAQGPDSSDLIVSDGREEGSRRGT